MECKALITGFYSLIKVYALINEVYALIMGV